MAKFTGGFVDEDALGGDGSATVEVARASEVIARVHAMTQLTGSEQVAAKAAVEGLVRETDPAILRNVKADVRFQSSTGPVEKQMTPMLYTAWVGALDMVSFMIHRCATDSKNAKLIARSLRNLFTAEVSRTPEEDVRPSEERATAVARLLGDDFGGGATRLREAVGVGAPSAGSGPAPAGSSSGAGGRSAPAASAAGSSSGSGSGSASGSGGGGPAGPEEARPMTATEKLMLARVDQLCTAAGKRDPVELEKLLAGYDKVVLKRLVNRKGTKGYTPLATAIMGGAYDTAEMLLERDADPNAPDQTPDGMPVLALAITTEGIDNVRITTLLLANNTNPNAVTPAGETMMELARLHSNRPIRYWLTIASTLPPVPEASLALEKHIGLARLRWLDFCIVGQLPAKRQVMSTMTSYFRLYDAKRRAGRPVVMLFPGPPGHGKTQLAKAIARIIQPLGKRTGGILPFETLNCSIDRSSDNIFGGPVSTVGKGAGKLTKICAKFHGEPAVILIDEIDKCDANALKGFYRVFDDGVLDNTGDAALPEIDCSRHVFVLTCNWAQKLIQTRDVDLRDVMDEMFDDEADPKRITDALHRMGVLLERLSDEVKDNIRATLSRMTSGFAGATGADALVGRMQKIVPFISLAPEEVAVITALFLEEFKAFLRKAPIPLSLGPGKYHGNIRVNIEESVVEFIAKRYRQADGVRSLQQEIRNLEDLTAMALRAEDIRDGDDVVFALRQTYVGDKPFDYITTFRKGEFPSTFDLVTAAKRTPEEEARAAEEAALAELAALEASEAERAKGESTAAPAALAASAGGST